MGHGRCDSTRRKRGSKRPGGRDILGEGGTIRRRPGAAHSEVETETHPPKRRTPDVIQSPVRFIGVRSFMPLLVRKLCLEGGRRVF